MPVPVFHDQPFVNPYAANMADEIAHSHDAMARAAEIVGQAQARATEMKAAAWGNAATSIGQIPTQIAEQQRRTQDADALAKLRNIEAQKGSMEVGGMQRAQRGQQLLAGLIQQYSKPDENGHTQVDYESVARELGGAGYPDEAAKYLKTANDNEEARTQIRQRKKALTDAETIAIARAAKDAADPGDFVSRLDDLVATGDIAQGRRDQILQQGNQVGDWSRFQKMRVDAGDAIAKPITTKADEVVSAGVSHTPIVTGPTKRENEAELAADAADPKSPTAAQSKIALDELRKQKNPPSLEDQYLAAKVKGDTAAAATILQTWRDKANASRDPVAAAQLEAIRRLSQQEAQARLDDRDPTSEKNQQKFEQEGRQVMVRAMSNRSGGVGSEDAKVQQANHLLALMDQFQDPKTGEYNIPRVQLNELALGLAKLTSGTSPAGEGLMKEFQQRTAKGDIAAGLTYLTGQAVSANTQDITKLLRESIERQGIVAYKNREGEMSYLRNLIPTDLNDDRRQKLEAAMLNPLKLRRPIPGAPGAVAESLDGGQTWKRVQ